MQFSHSRFIAKVQKTIVRYRMLSDGFTVVVAVSGGPDSVALLHVLHELKQRRYPSLTLHVAHLNHTLRGKESDEDEQFVQNLATKLGLKFTSTQLDVRRLAREQGRNLEEMAREERYRFLRDVAAHIKAQRIATGHTLTDQAETVLMRLIRGAGGEGLSAVHPVVDNLIIRPLLGVKREEVLAYCQSVGATYRIDQTNLEPALMRNRIRLEMLPHLSQFNPQVTEALARAAENLRLDEDYFDQIVGQLLPAYVTSSDEQSLSLAVKPLNDLHPAIRRRVMRAAIRQLQGSLRRVAQSHLEAVERLLESGMSGKRLHLPAGLAVRREFDMLTLSRKERRPKPFLHELVEGQVLEVGNFQLSLRRSLERDAAQQVPQAVLLDDEKLPPRLMVRSRRSGDRYIPAGRRRPKKLKELMIERRIPATQRDYWPIVVTAADQIVWVPRLPVAETFAPRRQTRVFAVISAQVR
jgi:tRNA(Ile)-lysidine synthase